MPDVHQPAGSRRRVGHRFGAATVAAIMIVIVLLVAGVTAAIVAPGNANETKPPQPTLPAPAATRTASGPAGAVKAPGTITPGPGPGTAPAGSTAGAVTIGDGISVTPPPGWTVEKQETGAVVLANNAVGAAVLVVVGKADTTDIGQLATEEIRAFVSNGGLTNPQLTTKPAQQALQSKNFQQQLVVGYSGDVQSQQGTSPIVGMFVVLLNPSTSASGFMALMTGSNNALNATAKDVAAMRDSML